MAHYAGASLEIFVSETIPFWSTVACKFTHYYECTTTTYISFYPHRIQVGNNQHPIGNKQNQIEDWGLGVVQIQKIRVSSNCTASLSKVFQ